MGEVVDCPTQLNLIFPLLIFLFVRNLLGGEEEGVGVLVVLTWPPVYMGG